ncbi:MAG: xanthine dehydrogenase family protein subunit M [Ilumatobacteraceae bacterium]
MKPARFTYHRPHSVAEVLALLAVEPEDTRILAGGQSLVPLMALRLSRPAHVVDIAHVPELSGIEAGDGIIEIGAMTRQRDIELSPVLRNHVPLLAAAAGHIGHVAIRHRGTIGGSLAHADPSAELPAVAVALGFEMVLHGQNGQRVVAAEDFFEGYLTTSIQPGELLTHVRIPLQEVPRRCAIEEFARRSGDFAIAGAVCAVDIGDGDLVRRARVVAMGVDPSPQRYCDAESRLVGSPLDGDSIAAAAAIVADACASADDIYGSDAYRRGLVHEMTRRALHRCAEEQ